MRIFATFATFGFPPSLADFPRRLRRERRLQTVFPCARARDGFGRRSDGNSLPFPSLPFPSLPFPSLPFPSLPLDAVSERSAQSTVKHISRVLYARLVERCDYSLQGT